VVCRLPGKLGACTNSMYQALSFLLPRTTAWEEGYALDLQKECFIKLPAQVKVCFMSTRPSELFMANWRFEKHSPKCYVNLR